jgi:hypothetical protein
VSPDHLNDALIFSSATAPGVFIGLSTVFKCSCKSDAQRRDRAVLGEPYQWGRKFELLDSGQDAPEWHHVSM